MKFEYRITIYECRMRTLGAINFLNHYSSFDIHYSNLHEWNIKDEFECRMMINECRMMKWGEGNFTNHYSSFDIRYSI